jgi:hypothetical protein
LVDGGAAGVGQAVGNGAERLELTRGGRLLAHADDNACSGFDVLLTAGLLPAPASKRHQIGGSDRDYGMAQLAATTSLTGATEWAQRVNIDANDVLGPAMT